MKNWTRIRKYTDPLGLVWVVVVSRPKKGFALHTEWRVFNPENHAAAEGETLHGFSRAFDNARKAMKRRWPKKPRVLNGVTIEPWVLTAVRRFCLNGERIKAIRELRLFTEANFKPTKRWVDDFCLEIGAPPNAPFGSHFLA